jgi:hypothetical protein
MIELAGQDNRDGDDDFDGKLKTNPNQTMAKLIHVTPKQITRKETIPLV